MIKNKYKTGDTFSIGNGVTAKVIEKIGTRYRLQFSNNIEGTFSERVVENNSFSNNILYTGATKDLGEPVCTIWIPLRTVYKAAAR